jgi:hypothetical protein
MRSFNAEGVFETEDGERLTLVCDFYTIDIVEGITGQNWDEIVPQISSSRALAVKVLYGLLRRKHETISLDEAAAVSYDKNSIALWAIMGDVIRRACNLPGGDEPEDDGAKKKRSGRRKTSADNG